MSKSKPYKEQDVIKQSVGEPIMEASTTNVANQQIPDYVWEDVRIGMEQYERGECRPVADFLKKYGRNL